MYFSKVISIFLQTLIFFDIKCYYRIKISKSQKLSKRYKKKIKVDLKWLKKYQKNKMNNIFSFEV